MTNNFFTTFGLKPNNFIERIEETKTIVSDFTSETPTKRVFLITGIRGSGKTVLLSSLAKHFKQLDDFIVVDISVKKNMLEHLASEIFEKGKMKKLFLESDFSFSFHGISISIKGKEPVSSVLSMLNKMFEYLNKKNKKVLICIDEVDSSSEMREFVTAFQTFIREDFPVLLLMTGLYETVDQLQNNESITFLYRAPKVYLGPLPINPIIESYEEALMVEKATAIELAKLTKGYAYAFQVLGYLYIEQESKGIDKRLLREYDLYLKEYVYDKIYPKLSNKEQEILLALNTSEKIKMNELSSKANVDIKTLSVYRDRLIKKGILSSPCYGYIIFSLPRFNEFLNEFRY